MRYTPAFDLALFVVGVVAAVQTVLGFTLPLLAFEISGAGTGRPMLCPILHPALASAPVLGSTRA